MNGITWIHIAGGMLALATGTVAFAVRKGGGMHVRAGRVLHGDVRSRRHRVDAGAVQVTAGIPDRRDHGVLLRRHRVDKRRSCSRPRAMCSTRIPGPS